MDPSTGQNNNKKNIVLSVLAGIGFAIVSFIITTLVVGATIYALSEMGESYCFESCAFMIMGISPAIGLVIALIVGVVGGRRIYKRLSIVTKINHQS